MENHRPNHYQASYRKAQENRIITNSNGVSFNHNGLYYAFFSQEKIKYF
jgi:hypothetical protein